MVYVFLANGFEEIEALTPVDLLRRAEIETKTVSISDELQVMGARRISVNADITLKDVDWDVADAVILPGGMPGTKNLAACGELMNHVKECAKAGICVAAICAAPALTLGENGILAGKKATCYPGMDEHLKGAEHVLQEVVTDGNIITSRGMGTAIAFSLAIIEKLADKETADRIGNSVVYKA